MLHSVMSVKSDRQGEPMYTWDEVRHRYPNRWVLVEALQAETIQHLRDIQSMRVLNTFEDFQSAWMDYLTYHRPQPKRELYVLHTKREHLNIEVVRSVGVAFRR